MKSWLKYDQVENWLYMNASVAFTSFLHDCVEHGLVEDHLDGVQLGQVLHLLPLRLLRELELLLLLVILPHPLVLGLLGVQCPSTVVPQVAMVDNSGHRNNTFAGYVAPF